MTVYVDDMEAAFGPMKMCHMLADSDDELHAMADAIGVQRRWHQKPPKCSTSHYDIAKSKRALAVNAGAVEITMRQASAMCARRRVSGELDSPQDALEWIANWRAEWRAFQGTAEANARAADSARLPPLSKRCPRVALHQAECTTTHTELKGVRL